MHLTWENGLYDFANHCMEVSWQKKEEGKVWESWKYTLPARVAYLADVIVNAVIVPFSLIGFLYGALHALCTWNRKSEVWQNNKAFALERTNHILLSTLGFAISPSLAHKYRDANITPYVIAIRIAAIASLVAYYAIKK